MIKTLFLLGVVFVLTYDPASGGLDNLFGAPQQQQQQQQQPAGRLEQYTVQAHPRVQQVQAQAQQDQNQIQVRAPSHYYGYANKHQHFEAVQFGTTGYEYRTNMPGASLY